METLLKKIRKELKQNIDPAYQKNNQRFFKEKIRCHGVRTPLVDKIAAKYFSALKTQDKKAIFFLCEELLKSDFNEEAAIAFDWSWRLKNRYTEDDFSIFQRWVENYINNWAKCDDFCTHTMGEFLQRYPQYKAKLKLWAKSQNRWQRRAAAVSLILPVRRGKFLADAFSISDILLEDRDDLVQKGYGWLLKEAGNLHQAQVLQYVQKNKQKMPRTALRYAVEKFPQKLKKIALARTK